jgi:hypothetical protein
MRVVDVPAVKSVLMAGAYRRERPPRVRHEHALHGRRASAKAGSACVPDCDEGRIVAIEGHIYAEREIGRSSVNVKQVTPGLKYAVVDPYPRMESGPLRL